jgi:hypothetical protein
MIWAPLTKSPNCASQSTSASGAAIRVAVLETDRRVLGERRVVHLERGGRVGEVLDRRVALGRVRIVEDEVTVRERAALSVLSREPDRDALDEQAGVGERLGLPPVDPAVDDGVAAPLELARQLRVDREVLGDGEKLGVQLAQAISRDRGDDPLRRGRLREGRRFRRAGCRSVLERRLQTLVGRTEHLADPRLERSRVVCADRPLRGQPLRELLAHGRMCIDVMGHERLRIGGLVLLVVTEAAVADEVDDDVVAEPARKASARRIAEIAASGSSAFTWMIGMSKPFARSLE